MNFIDLESAHVIKLRHLYSIAQLKSIRNTSANEFAIIFITKCRYQEVNGKAGNPLGLLELTVVDDSWVSNSKESNDTCLIQCWGQKASDRLRFSLGSGSLVVVHQPSILIKSVTISQTSMQTNQIILQGDIIACTVLGTTSLSFEWLDAHSRIYAGELKVFDSYGEQFSQWLTSQVDLALIRQMNTTRISTRKVTFDECYRMKYKYYFHITVWIAVGDILQKKKSLRMIDPDNELAQLVVRCDSLSTTLYDSIFSIFTAAPDRSHSEDFSYNVIYSMISKLSVHEDFIVLLNDDYRPLKKGEEYYLPITLHDIAIQYAHGLKARRFIAREFVTWQWVTTYLSSTISMGVDSDGVRTDAVESTSLPLNDDSLIEEELFPKLQYLEWNELSDMMKSTTLTEMKRVLVYGRLHEVHFASRHVSSCMNNIVIQSSTADTSLLQEEMQNEVLYRDAYLQFRAASKPLPWSKIYEKLMNMHDPQDTEPHSLSYTNTTSQSSTKSTSKQKNRRITIYEEIAMCLMQRIQVQSLTQCTQLSKSHAPTTSNNLQRTLIESQYLSMLTSFSNPSISTMTNHPTTIISENNVLYTPQHIAITTIVHDAVLQHLFADIPAQLYAYSYADPHKQKNRPQYHIHVLNMINSLYEMAQESGYDDDLLIVIQLTPCFEEDDGIFMEQSIGVTLEFLFV